MAQYLKEERQSGNEIWSDNKIFYEKYFFFKNHAEIETERLVPDLFWFFKRPLHTYKVNIL